MKPIFRIGLIGLLIALTVKVLNDLDMNKVVYNHAPGKCKYVEGIDNGSEDLVVLSNGQVLISSGVYLPIAASQCKPGKLYLYDPSKDDSKAEPLTIKSEDESWKEEEFFPCGITVWEEKGTLVPCVDSDPKCPEWAGKGECQTNRNWMMKNCPQACHICPLGETTVYVINSFKHQVDIFQLKIYEKLLIHKKSVSHPSVSNPNNLIAIGKDQFYLTNFVYYSHPIGFALEFTQKLPFGTVWFHDGEQLTQVLGGLKGPNGIAVSKSKDFLYIATHMEERVRVYRIESSPSNLTAVSTIDLHTGVDNINVDQQGSVWIGAHPIAYKSVLHLFNTKRQAPSQVLKINFNDDHSNWRVQEAYSDDGSFLSGSTTAAATIDGQKLIIGSLMHKTIICEINQ